MAQKTHTMHGRDHQPWGADPLVLMPGASSLPDYIRTFTTLQAWYRLGSGDPDDLSEALDSSGHSRDLALVAGATHPPTHVAHPDLGGDDGATRFNHAQLQSSDLGGSYFTGLNRYPPSGSDPGWTLIGFVEPLDAEAGWLEQNGGVLPAHDSYLAIPFGAWNVGGTPSGGAAFMFSPASRAVTAAWKADASTVTLDPGVGLSLNMWHLLALVWDHNASTVSLYVDATLVAESAATFAAANQPVYIGTGDQIVSGSPHFCCFYGAVDEVCVLAEPLSADQIAAFYAAGVGGAVDTSDLVVGVDDNGNLGMVNPKIDVTVNGAPPSGPVTAIRDDGHIVGDDWINDQPFLHGGAAFTVEPNKWTTIPFTSPLMERESNLDDGAGHILTRWTELDWDDPAAAGWIDPSEPHAITIPHDMPFLDDPYSWIQVSLRLESPMVEPAKSYRALRVFETTHQKTLIVAEADRDLADDEGGAINVWRDTSAPGWTPVGGSSLYASGGRGDSDLPVMVIPNSGYAFYLDGLTWLPKGGSDGITPVLKEGMRLVAQVWHDAGQPLTFHLDAGYPYAPHFVVFQLADRGWGPPWSDWPEP